MQSDFKLLNWLPRGTGQWLQIDRKFLDSSKTQSNMQVNKHAVLENSQIPPLLHQTNNLGSQPMRSPPFHSLLPQSDEFCPLSAGLFVQCWFVCSVTR